MEYIFNQAKPVWETDLKNRYNQFLGFYAEIKEHRKKKYLHDYPSLTR